MQPPPPPPLPPCATPYESVLRSHGRPVPGTPWPPAKQPRTLALMLPPQRHLQRPQTHDAAQATTQPTAAAAVPLHPVQPGCDCLWVHCSRCGYCGENAEFYESDVQQQQQQQQEQALSLALPLALDLEQPQQLQEPQLLCWRCAGACYFCGGNAEGASGVRRVTLRVKVLRLGSSALSPTVVVTLCGACYAAALEQGAVDSDAALRCCVETCAQAAVSICVAPARTYAPRAGECRLLCQQHTDKMIARLTAQQAPVWTSTSPLLLRQPLVADGVDVEGRGQ